MAIPLSYAETPSRVSRHLTIRQATVIFIIVALLALLTSSLQIFVAWRAERERIVTVTDQTLDMISAPAVEAAYQMNADLAKQVVVGLFQDPSITRIVLRDNFGTVLAERRRLVEDSEKTTFCGSLFADLTDYSRQLTSGKGANRAFFGTLALHLSANDLGDVFIKKALVTGALLIGQALLVCGLVIIVVYQMSTKPITRIARDIGQIDIAQPAALPVPAPRHHEHDELGVLTAALNTLLRAFQQRLDHRDRTERDLRALTLDLKQRLTDRTCDLEQMLTQLNIEKDETEQAFHKLDQANSLILESLHYARKIQDSRLPDKTALDGTFVNLHVVSKPLHVVGGDYFWLEQIGDKSLIFIADCTGHGVPGAFMTMVVASALDVILHQDREVQPTMILERLDERVRTRLHQDRPDIGAGDSLDAAVCVYDRTNGRIAFAGANISLLFSEGNDWTKLRGDRTSLGNGHVRQRGALTAHEFAVRPGTTFYLFTNGAADHMGNPPHRLLGRQRLTDILTTALGATIEERLSQVEIMLDTDRAGDARQDDMTIITFIPR